MEVRFVPSAAATTFHATERLLQGRPLVQAGLADRLGEATDVARIALDDAGVDISLFFAHFTAAVADANVRHATEVALAKTIGAGAGQQAFDTVASAMTTFRAAFDSTAPDIAGELVHRAEPLRLQWEARGPGILAAIRRLTGDEFLVSNARVLLVAPICGGGGEAHPLYNAVRFEAVLADSVAELPETVRLAWLLAALNLDLPTMADGLLNNRLVDLGPAALVPLVLSAGAEVELTARPPEAIPSALKTWDVTHPRYDADYVAAVLGDWWSTYLDNRPPFSAALAALDRLLP